MDNERADNKNDAKQNGLNIRAILGLFYIGTGHVDNGKPLSFLGIPGGPLWHNTFYSNSEIANAGIITLCRDIIGVALKLETAAIIREKLGVKCLPQEIEKYVNNFINDSNDMPVDMLNIRIIISYDMGLQKRSIDPIYDLLSGYGFMIRCIMGKLVTLGLKPKLF